MALGVRYTISDDSAIQSAYNSYTSEGTYYNSADVLVVYAFPSGRVIQFCIQASGESIKRVWVRMLVGTTWTKPLELLNGKS